MLRTIRLVRVNLKKTLSSYGFFASTFLTIILLFTSSLYYDYSINRDFSIIQVFLKFNRTDMLNDTRLCSYNVLQECVSGWLKMFIPMIASFPFVSLQCTERAAGTVRFSGIRLPKQSYQTGTFLSAMISGGFVLISGFAVFSICSELMFPNITEYDTALREEYELYFSDTYTLFNMLGYPYLIMLRFFEMFLYGAVSAVPACFMTCLLKNKYLVISIPFFLKYMLLQNISRLQTAAYADLEHIDERFLSFLNIINPDAVSKLSSYGIDIWKNIMFYAILLIIAYVVYCVIMNRRWDYGT